MNLKINIISCALALCAGVVVVRAATGALAQEALPEIRLVDGKFEPAELTVPAHTAFKLRVSNADKAAIEFESFELHRERVVQPGESVTVYMPALAPGRYEFVDDFHSDTPPGVIVAK